MNSLASVYAYTRPSDGGYSRLISRTSLELVKALRSEGYAVKVEPDDGTPIEYLVRKGEFDLLQDPLFVQLINIPVSILTGLATTWLYNRLSKGRRNAEKLKSNIAVRVLHEGTIRFYDHAGREIPEERAKEVFGLHAAQAEILGKLGMTQSPDPDKPFPICLEHTSEIIGWVRLREETKGLLGSATIDDDETWERIQQGELRGLSIAGMVQVSECSICQRDYTECNHISGLEYEGKECLNTIKKLDILEVSIVREPVNQECLIDLKKGPGISDET